MNSPFNPRSCEAAPCGESEVYIRGFIRLLFLIIIIGVSTTLSSAAKSLDLKQLSSTCGFQVIPAVVEYPYNKLGVICDKWLSLTAIDCDEGGHEGDPMPPDFDRTKYPGHSVAVRKLACDIYIKAYESGRGAINFYIGALIRRARIENRLTEYDLAIGDLDKYFRVAASPAAAKISRIYSDPDAYRIRAVAHYNRKEYDRALSDLDEMSLNDWTYPYHDPGSPYYHDWESHYLEDLLKSRGINLSFADFKSPAKVASLPIETFKGLSFHAVWSASEIRGDIALAQKHYELALRHYENYSKVFPETPGLAEKIALTKKMMEAAKTGAPLPPPQPGSPSPLPPACKMYPNLC